MTHPEASRLSDFARGLLAPDGADEVERHLAECPECCERAASAGKDGFIACLQSAAGSASSKETHPSLALQATQAEALGVIPPALRDHPRYRVLRLLGKGGMGEVWLAEHRVMQRMVALKVIRQDLVSSPELAERFRREVLAAAKLSHPNIVAALDAEQAGDTHFLVMEFVDGASVAMHLRSQGPLPVAEACDIARQAALALQHAHSQGLVHRDIKPENLLRSSDGTVKVADFGLARLLRGPEAVTTATSSGILVGTIDYIAPEQANDAARADIRADIYSLGCTLYHLLTGQTPYPGGGVLDKLTRHMGGRPMRLTQLRPDVPLALARVVERLMSPDPAKRFATPGEAAAALEPFTRPTPAKPPARWPWIAAAALLLGAGLAAGVAVYTLQTSKGTIVVESDDPDVTVIVKRRGETVTVIDEKTGRKVDITPGEYELSLSENGKKLELSTSRVSLTRGGKVIVRVTFKKEAPPIPVVKLLHLPREEVTTPPVKVEEAFKWPADLAEVMKERPDIDDNFRDPRSSTYDPTDKKGKKIIERVLKVRAEFEGGALHASFDRLEEAQDRFAVFTHDDLPAAEYLFIARARLPADSPASWGVEIKSTKAGHAFLVRLWNDGRLQIGPGPRSGKDAPRPNDVRVEHRAIRKGGEPNDLALEIKGRTMRVFVNGVRVLPPVPLTAGYEETSAALFCHFGDVGPARVTFERARRWVAGQAAPAAGLPADTRETMKAAPDVDDRFDDRKTSPFDRARGKTAFWGSKEFGTEVRYGKGGAEVLFHASEKGSRQMALTHDAGTASEYVCRVSGRVEGEQAGAWGMTVQGKDVGEVFAIRAWNSGMLEIGPTRATTAEVPVFKKARVAALKGGKERDELVVSIRGGELRVWANGQEAAGPLDLPAAFQVSNQGIHAYHASGEAGKIVIERFTRWARPAAAPDPATPADLARIKPEIDDDFKETKGSVFDHDGDGRSVSEIKDLNIRAALVKGEGYVLEAKPTEKLVPRFGFSFPAEPKVSGDFACLVRGKIATEELGYIAVALEGEDGAALTVRAWKSGVVNIGQFPRTGRDFSLPRLKTSGHERGHAGGRENELLVVVQGGVMRVYINGKTAADPVTLPPGLRPPSVGFMLCQDGQQEGRIVLTRFKRWRLGAARPAVGRAPIGPADLVRLKPILDDDLRDPSVSPFDASRGAHPRREDKALALALDFSKSEGCVMEFGPLPDSRRGKPRNLHILPDNAPEADFACRIRGKMTTEDPAYLGIALRGRKEGAELIVRLHSTGAVETGEFTATAPGLAMPRLRTAPLKAFRRGEMNELLVIVQGGSMRAYVNGEPAAPAASLPDGMEATKSGLVACQVGNKAGRYVFDRFTLWRLGGKAAAAPPRAATRPADLEKRKPDIDDDFEDAKNSPFDPSRGRSTRAVYKDLKIEADYVKGEGYTATFGGLASPDVRYAFAFPEDASVSSFACRIRGRFKADDAGYFGLALHGKEGAQMTVRVWNTGRLQLGRSKRTADDFPVPVLKTAGHAAPKAGDAANELLVVVEGGVMRLYLDGKPAADSVKLPAGLERAEVGLILCHNGQKAARGAVRRFTLWRLEE